MRVWPPSRVTPGKRLLRPALFASALAAAACAPSGPSADPARGPAPEAVPDSTAAAAAGHADHGMMQPLPASAGSGHTIADVQFMQHMIGHHAQALVMAAMAPTHGAGEKLLYLAQKIDISQRDEIGMMQDWLEERGQAVPTEHHVHGMQMPGMLTPEQLARLDAARGREFERLFLEFMIAHHRGAIEMVDTLFDAPEAAQDPDIFRFATDVVADQLAEIDQMTYLLNTLQTH